MNAESSELAEEPTGLHRMGRVSEVEVTRHLPRIEQVERRPGRLHWQEKVYLVTLAD